MRLTTFRAADVLRMASKVGLIPVLLVLLAGSALAQFTTARLSGTVTDGTGSAIPGAQVVIRQTGSGYQQTASTGADGAYLFPSLPVGSYQLTVEKMGFSTYVQSGIVLTVGQNANQEVALKVGAVTQEVNVQANASMVTTDSPALGQLVSEKSMIALPLNGREAQQLVFLVPGAVDVSAQNCGADCEGGVLPGEQYAKINGGGSNGVAYLLDGVDYNDTYINANLPFPNPDALQEFNVQTDNMSAVYGNATGGVVNIVTRSGNDAIHGDAFEFLRNYAMDARNYFATSPDPLKQNQFGATLGGPILKGRLFYFGSWQSTRTKTAQNGQIAFVPTDAERQGDFSDLLPDTQLTDPATGAPFLNNQIPVTRLSSVAQYLLGHIPLPNGPGRQLSYNAAPTVQNTDEYLAKLDYDIGKHHLSGHYFQMHYNVPTILPPASNVLAGNTEAPQDLALKNVSIVDIYTISDKMLLSSYFGYTSQNGETLSAAPFNMADAGVKIAQPTNFKPPLNFYVGGEFGIAAQLGAVGEWDRGDQSLREVVTRTAGTHEIQFGGEVKRIRAPMGNIYQANGTFSFDNSLSGDNIADFLLGNLSYFTQGGGLYLNFTGIDWSAFVQDDWKVNPRLTVSAGLRWDPFIPYKDSEGRVACFVPGSQSARFPNAPSGVIFGGSHHDRGCPTASIFDNLSNFGPRVGFALRLTSDSKTSLRGGAGYYYEPPNTVAFEDVVGIPPFAPIVNLTDVDLADPYGSAEIANPFPAQFGPTNPGPSASFPQNISFTQIFDRHFRLPQVLTWNLTLERGIGTSWLLRAAYLGNKASHLSGTGDQEAGLLQLNPAIYIPGQSSEANTQQRRKYPSFGFINSINSGVNSNYHALQLTGERRFAQGLSLLANFTWSRALNDFGPNGQPGYAGTNSCSCGRRFDYGPDAGDVNKIVRLSGTYTPPQVHWKGFAGRAVNGWSLTGTANWQTGFPFTIFSDDDNSFSAIGADRADILSPDVHKAKLSTSRSHAEQIQEWFRTADFTANAVGTFGNTGKNILRGPRSFNTDLALLKDTAVTERVRLQFRAEFYNALNNVNFDLPDSGLTDSSFGQISSAESPRILQVALKAVF
jgi:hypothetical protein